MLIRAETPADHDEIGAVADAAFGRATEARMVEAIRASDGFVPELSLVAEQDGRILGHVMLSYVQLEGTDTRLIELGPLSVAPEHQRRGVGSALVQESLRLAEARGEPLVLVLGHPTYYPRFGFRPASELGIQPPDPSIPNEAFMAIPLAEYDPDLQGQVVFPAAYSIE